MGVEINDLELTSADDYYSEIQTAAGGPGSSQRRGNPFRGAWDLSGNQPPTGTGSGTGGMNLGGDTWYASAGGDIDPDGLGTQFFPANTMIIAKFAGATNAVDFLWQG